MEGTVPTVAMSRALERWEQLAARRFPRAAAWLSGAEPRAKRRRLLALAACVAAAYALFGGDQGLLALASTQRQKAALRSEIEGLRAGNAALERDIARLASSPQLYEKTAREELLLKKPGELIYRFRD